MSFRIADTTLHEIPFYFFLFAIFISKLTLWGHPRNIKLDNEYDKRPCVV